MPQTSRETWDRKNHLWAGRKNLEGYAVCQNCAHPENSAEAAKPCTEGPATTQVLNELITLMARFMKLEAKRDNADVQCNEAHELLARTQRKMAGQDTELTTLRARVAKLEQSCLCHTQPPKVLYGAKGKCSRCGRVWSIDKPPPDTGEDE